MVREPRHERRRRRRWTIVRRTQRRRRRPRWWSRWRRRFRRTRCAPRGLVGRRRRRRCSPSRRRSPSSCWRLLVQRRRLVRRSSPARRRRRWIQPSWRQSRRILRFVVITKNKRTDPNRGERQPQATSGAVSLFVLFLLPVLHLCFSPLSSPVPSSRSHLFAQQPRPHSLPSSHPPLLSSPVPFPLTVLLILTVARISAFKPIYWRPRIASFRCAWLLCVSIPLPAALRRSPPTQCHSPLVLFFVRFLFLLPLSPIACGPSSPLPVCGVC